MARILGDFFVMLLTFSSAQLWIVTDSVERCKHYPNPKNGHVVCDSLFRLFCTPECAEGFTFEFKPAVVYMCGPLTGKWFTYPEGENIPWPDCVKRKSANAYNVEDEVATRRAQIAQKIHETHQGIVLNNHQTQSTQYVGHPNARYLHLFDYIQRAQQMYNNQQSASLGYSSLEQQRQLKSKQQQYQRQQQLYNRQQQQKRKQLQMQQQLQRRQQLIQQQKFIQHERNVQREMMEKQRQQRDAFEAAVTNFQQNVVAPQSTTWRSFAYLKPISPGRAATSSTYYPTMPQTNYGINKVATGNVNQQQRNPEIKEYSVDSPQQNNNVIDSSLHNSQVQNNRMAIKERVPLVTVSQLQPTTSTLPLPDLNKVVPSSHQNLFTNLTVRPLQHNPISAHVSYPPASTSQITSPRINVSSTNQPQYRISQSNQLQVGNQLNDALKRESPQLVTQQAAGQVNQFSLTPAPSSVFQRHADGPPRPSMEMNHDLNKTSQIERRAGVGDGTEIPTQERLKTKEKLFYFPIKRDTLIKMLPLNIQEKYRSLREARNINSSYEASHGKEKENITALEEIKIQNVTHKNYYSTASISNFKYSVRQIERGDNSVTEHFDLLPQDTSKNISSTTNSSNHGEMSNKLIMQP